jgi:hypothetical protein
MYLTLLWFIFFVILVGLVIRNFAYSTKVYLFNFLIVFVLLRTNSLIQLVLFSPFYYYHNYGYKRFATTSQYYVGPFYTGFLSFLLFHKKPVKRIFPKRNFQRAFFVLFCVMSYLYICFNFFFI